MKEKLLNFANRLKNENKVINEWRKNRPVTPLSNLLQRIFCVISILFLVFTWVFSYPVSASAAELSSDNSILIYEEGPVPSDLTGYTVTVPAGWTASPGFGMFSLATDESGIFTSVGIGYNFDGMRSIIPQDNAFTFFDEGGFPSPDSSYDGVAFSFKVYSDNVSSSQRSSLNNWLIQNNATFTLSSTPPSETYVVESGMYRLDLKPFPFTTSVDSFLLNFDFSTVSQDGFDGISLNSTVYNNSRYISGVSYLRGGLSVPVITDDGVPGIPHYNTSSEGYTFIYLPDDVDLVSSDNLDLFNSIFTPFAGDYDDSILFYSLGEIDGYSSGFLSGYGDGYYVGFDEGASLVDEGTFLGNIVQNILDALDKFTIVGSFSYLDLIKVLIGAFVLIFFLKLLAGG